MTLAGNREIYGLLLSITQVEDRFNGKFNYDWVFFKDVSFTEEFIKLTTSAVSGDTYYEVVPKEHWSYPDWIDQERFLRYGTILKNSSMLTPNISRKIVSDNSLLAMLGKLIMAVISGQISKSPPLISLDVKHMDRFL